ncbi:hypothetical protein R3P38DRAFT_3202163 [Favolaschia claudopus]|uniref:Uncharacterized protein n=1 Tax=Favolaschia claudopus TaxID=2862362 RepID=A0AAW0AU84_9AGAR
MFVFASGATTPSLDFKTHQPDADTSSNGYVAPFGLWERENAGNDGYEVFAKIGGLVPRSIYIDLNLARRRFTDASRMLFFLRIYTVTLSFDFARAFVGSIPFEFEPIDWYRPIFGAPDCLDQRRRMIRVRNAPSTFNYFDTNVYRDYVGQNYARLK